MVRYVGSRIIQVVLFLLRGARQWLRDGGSAPADEQREIGRQPVRDRSKATDHAFRLGEMLLEIRAECDPDSWRDALKRLGISAATARNKILLAQLADRAPDLYRRLRPMGPTKIYRIAALPDEELSALDPDDVVQVERGPVKLSRLTDRQLIRHLREICPPTQRKHARNVGRDLCRLIKHPPKEPLAWTDLESRSDGEIIYMCLQEARSMAGRALPTVVQRR